MESSNTVTKDSSNSLTVSIFLEICILQRKTGKTRDDVSEHIKDVYKMTINPLKIHKLQKVLQEKLSKMSKNKLKSELQNLKQDNLINYISLQGGKGKRNENYIQGPSHSNVRTANHLQEAEFRNQVMKNQNTILKEIVTEQSQNIWKLKTEYKTLSSKLFIVKSSTKQSQILRKQNTELKTELKDKKETVKSMKKENYYKKLQRREKKQDISIQEIQNKKLENAKLKKHIYNLNEKRAETKRRHKKMLDQATYLRQQYERAKREKEGIKGKLKSVTEEIKELKIENDDLKLQQTENRSVSTLSNRRYNDDIRTCVMELQSLEIPSNKVFEVIKSVSENICKMKVEKLPKRTTVQNIIDEGHFLAKEQVSEAIAESRNWDLFADGTSRDGKKIVDAGVHLADKRSLSFGFQSVAREDGETVANLLKGLIDEASEISSSTQNDSKSETFSNMLNSLASLMSDRSSVMKKSNVILSEWREKMLKEHFPDVEVPLLHFLYCSAHILLGFHSEVDSNLQQLDKAEGILNNIKESRAVKTIRRVCELFGPRGDERNGRREDWLAYMKLTDKTSKIISYRANRFNNLFSGAETVIDHRDDISSFVNDYVNQPNEKLKSVVSDLQCEYIITQIRSLAIISNIVTAPLWSIINGTTVHHLDLHQYFQPLKNHLALWSTNSTPLLTSPPSIFPDYPNKTCDKLYEGTAPCKETLQILCSSLLNVVKRQLSDHLEDGIYGKDCSMVERQRTAHSKLTNLPAEHYFGDLDYSIRRKRNATVMHHSGVIMLKRNRTVKWIKQKSKVAQKILIKKGMKEGRKLRQTQKLYEKQVKQKRVEVMKKLKYQKEQKEQKKCIELAKITSTVDNHGGLCTSEAHIDHLIQQYQNITAKKTALRNHILYYKLVSKITGCEKQWFCLSLHGKPCSIEQLRSKLLNIILWNAEQ